jgi:hypothetical protein
MFCTCIIVVDLIFADFRFDLFRIEICKIASKCEFPPSVSIKMPPCAGHIRKNALSPAPDHDPQRVIVFTRKITHQKLMPNG